MTNYNDSQGMAYSAASAASVQRFESLIPTFMGFRREMMKQLAGILEADPEMPMANCAKGYFMKMSGASELTPIANQQLALMDTMAAAGRLNPREQMHRHALGQWCDGDMDGATETWEQILLEYPLDGLALRLAHFTHFYSGDGRKTPCRSGPRTMPATVTCWACTASGWRRRATTPRPSISGGEPSRSTRRTPGRSTRLLIAWR
jgi:hypothetical protein